MAGVEKLSGQNTSYNWESQEDIARDFACRADDQKFQEVYREFLPLVREARVRNFLGTIFQRCLNAAGVERFKNAAGDEAIHMERQPLP